MANRKRQPPPAKDQPDCMVWREHGAGRWLCTLCVTTDTRRAADGLGAAYRAATAHLWSTHCIKRVWIIEHRPELHAAAQLALPLVAAHNTQFDRGW